MTHDTTHAMPAASRSESVLSIVVVDGPDAGLRRLVDEPLVVGTSEACDVRLTDPTVSRRHAVIEPSPFGLRVRDQDSRNGTFVGGTHVRDADVAVGLELRLGSTTVRVEEAAASSSEGDTREPPSSFGRFRGRAPALSRTYAQLEAAARSEATVLLEGESGTGKELLAEALHESSARAEGPFVVVDCGAFPESLIESELFGHERGAFTGADRTRAGAFELAQGGTIFLDEVGELPLPMQTRLLRVLDRRQVRRVGGDERIDVDVRVVAATNRNLDREVEEGRFRLDLFHRLAVFLVRVPPLRERVEDVPELARAFATQLGGDETVLDDAVVARLVACPWPGNVRELRNYVERLILLGEDASAPGTLARTDDPIGASVAAGLPYRKARALAIDAFTDRYVEAMLLRHGGNVSHAARAAGIARRHFQRLKRRE